MGGAGAILVLGAWPLAFLIAVIAGGGHGSPFGHSAAEATLGGAMLGVPALLLLVGLALLWAARTGRWVPAAVIALLIPSDVGVAVAVLWQVNRPQPPVIYTAADPKTVLPGRPIIAVPACTPDHRCSSAPPARDLGQGKPRATDIEVVTSPARP